MRMTQSRRESQMYFGDENLPIKTLTSQKFSPKPSSREDLSSGPSNKSYFKVGTCWSPRYFLISSSSCIFVAYLQIVLISSPFLVMETAAASFLNTESSISIRVSSSIYSAILTELRALLTSQTDPYTFPKCFLKMAAITN